MDKRAVPARIRRAVIDFRLDEARRGEVGRFCEANKISVPVFYKIRKQAREQGEQAALLPRSSAAKTVANRTDAQIEQAAIDIRAELTKDGWDAGPLSVGQEMAKRGITPVPSRAALARIFSRHGLVTPQPQKRPRSSYVRFQDPQPNGCWQLDGFEWMLDGKAGKAVVFQVIDDNSRQIMASGSDTSENGRAAIEVVSRAIAEHGTPQRFLTDNSTAFNSSRRGWIAPLEAYLLRLGVKPITGRPNKPTTQGKAERSHQTAQKFLEAHRPVYSLTHLDRLLDEFADYYNNHRPHQAHPDPFEISRHLTPAHVYHACPKASPPEPPEPTSPPQDAEEKLATLTHKTINHLGRVNIGRTCIYLGIEREGQIVHCLVAESYIEVFDQNGESFGAVPRPPKGHPATHHNLTTRHSPLQRGETQTTNR